MSVTERDGYRIGVDTLPSGKIRAKARGTKSNTRTFTKPSTEDYEAHAHAEAALFVAQLIEGAGADPVPAERVGVKKASSGPNRAGYLGTDWIIEILDEESIT